MTYVCKCNVCGMIDALSGSDDPDTNSFEVYEEMSCGHEDYEVIDTEYEDLVGDEVI